MRFRIGVLGSIAALALVAGCTKTPTQPAAAPDAPVDLTMTAGAIPASDPVELAAFQAATRKLYDFKEKAFAEGKADPIVNRFYAENAISVGPDGKPHEGRAAFLENYKQVVVPYTVKVEPVHAFVKGDAGWEWANFRVTPKDPQSAEKPFSFAILFLWTKVGGQWVSAGDSYVLGEFPAK